VIATDPAVGTILRRQDQKLDRQDQKLDVVVSAINSLITKLDDRLGKVEERHAEPMATLAQLEERHVDSMAKMEDRLLAKIGTFHGQFGDIRMDVNNHEQRLVTLKSIVTDHGSRLNALTSDLLLQESVLKGYKDTNDTIVATLRTDVNDTHAKFPGLRREIQELTAGLTTSIKDVEALVHREVRDSAVELRREYQDSAAGLATSIKEVAPQKVGGISPCR